MTRAELIELGYNILAAKTEMESNELMDLFDRNINHPNGSSLFFNPEKNDKEEH